MIYCLERSERKIERRGYGGALKSEFVSKCSDGFMSRASISIDNLKEEERSILGGMIYSFFIISTTFNAVVYASFYPNPRPSHQDL